MNIINIADKRSGLVKSCILVTMNASVYEGRKKDKDIEAEIAEEKNARNKRATSVHKNLFVDCAELEAVKSIRNAARLWLNRVTEPWDDNGWRVLPMMVYIDTVRDEASRYEQAFNAAVQKFISHYDTAISKQAFERGSMFNRAEYPTAKEVAEKFNLQFAFRPMPMRGDFRVDADNELIAELEAQAEAQASASVQKALASSWERMQDMVGRWKERMTACLEFDEDKVEEERILNEDGTVKEIKIKKPRRPKLHDTMLDHGLELCEMMKHLNITGDSNLELARQKLEAALVHLDMDSLKTSQEVQSATLKKMEEISELFNF